MEICRLCLQNNKGEQEEIHNTNSEQIVSLLNELIPSTVIKYI